MKPIAYTVTTLLALCCLALSGTWIWLSYATNDLRLRVQQQQAVITRGVLGPQGVEISNNILRDMANVAAGDPAMRRLLETHGYRVQATAAEPTPVLEAGAMTLAPAEAANPAAIPETEDQP